MIAYLKGKIKFKKDNFIILENNGIGYKINVAAGIINDKKIGVELELFIHEHLREDADDFYGFSDADELDFFESLISVSGIGPKSAMNILSRFKTQDLKQSIIHGDLGALTKVSGIGKKTAERLILELKNKLATKDIKGIYQPHVDVDDDALEALISLGYSKKQAEIALAKLGKDLSLEDKVKQALKNI